MAKFFHILVEEVVSFDLHGYTWGLGILFVLILTFLKKIAL